MAKKTTLTVTSALGTFTRTTVRTYSHLVVVKGYKADVLEARRLSEIAARRKEAARYRRVLAAGVDVTDRTGFQRDCTAEYLAEGRYAQWADECDADAAALEALGPITEDGASWNPADTSAPSWAVAGWCGRPDLAVKLAAQQDTYRHVALVALDGTVTTIR